MWPARGRRRGRPRLDDLLLRRRDRPGARWPNRRHAAAHAARLIAVRGAFAPVHPPTRAETVLVAPVKRRHLVEERVAVADAYNVREFFIRTRGGVRWLGESRRYDQELFFHAQRPKRGARW